MVVRGAQDLSADVAKEFIAYLAAPEEDVAVVLAHKGGAKGGGTRAAQRAGAMSIACAEVKRYTDKVAFVRAEAHGVAVHE